jgi:hypothetical protein
MENRAWAALLRHISPEQHDQYMLVTVGGTEIAIQGLLRIDHEFVIIKGRLSGSQEAGRVFFLPFAQIDYFGTQKPVKDSEFNEVFASLVIPTEPSTTAASTAPPEAPVAPSHAPARGSGPRPAIRSEVLDRYRSRPSSSAILPPARPSGS